MMPNTTLCPSDWTLSLCAHHNAALISALLFYQVVKGHQNNAKQHRFLIESTALVFGK